MFRSGSLALALVAILLSALSAGPVVVPSADQQPTPNATLSYVTHGYISITKDSDFASLGFPGGGIAGNPYRIEGYEISASGGELIQILDTTAYFVIQNNLLNGQDQLGESVYLKNVANGVVSGNIIMNNRHGIYVDTGCASISIVGNTINQTSQSAVRVNHSEYIDIEENVAYDYTYNGIWLNASHHCTVTGNTVHGDEIGIWVKNGCYEVEVSNNTVYDTDTSILISDSSYDAEVYRNSIYDKSLVSENTLGIYVTTSSHDIDVLNNTVSRCDLYGIGLGSGSSSNLVKWNSLIGNNAEGSTQGSDNGTDNTVDYNFWDEWTTPDESPADGIVDIPYALNGTSGNSDPHPLAAPINPISYHYLTPVVVLYPNGGELVNMTAAIQWTPSLDSLDHYVGYWVYYSPNSGTDWYQIVANITEGQFSWNTTETPRGSTYMIRVVANCSDGLAVSDISDGAFTLNEHTLAPPEVEYPNGSEIVFGSVDVSWSGAVDSWGHPIQYSLEYSSNGGSDWTPLVSGLTATSFTWDSTGAPDGEDYLLKVIAMCEKDLVAEDASDAVFTVRQHAVQTPTVLYPNGGELVNATATVQWVVSEDSLGHAVHYSVYYSPNAGEEWILLASDLTSTSYLWDTTSLLRTGGYTVKVVAECAEEITAEDSSDASFTLNPHTVMLSTIGIFWAPSDPVGPEEPIHDTVLIEWEPAVDSWGFEVSYAIYFSPDSGVHWAELAADLLVTSYSWDTTTLPDGDTYRIKVVATSLAIEAESPVLSCNIQNAGTTSTTTTTTTTTTATTTTTTTTTTTGTTTGEIVNPLPLVGGIVLAFSIVIIVVLLFLSKKTGFFKRGG